MGTPDWELYFAFMEGVPGNMTLGIPADELADLQTAVTLLGKSHGIRTVGEFIELALWERLEREVWQVPYDTIVSPTLAPCFFCGELTDLVDINFEAAFCGSATCEWAINEDLRMSATRASQAQASSAEWPFL